MNRYVNQRINPLTHKLFFNYYNLKEFADNKLKINVRKLKHSYRVGNTAKSRAISPFQKMISKNISEDFQKIYNMYHKNVKMRI